MYFFKFQLPSSRGCTYPFMVTTLERKKRYIFTVPIQNKLSITYGFVVPNIDIYLAIEIPHEHFALRIPVIDVIDVTFTETYCRQEDIEVIEAEWVEHRERILISVECIETEKGLYQPRATAIILSPLSQVWPKERVLESDTRPFDLLKKNDALVDVFVESTDENEYVTPLIETGEEKQEITSKRLVDVSVFLDTVDQTYRRSMLIESMEPVWGEATIKENLLDTELIEQSLSQIYAFKTYEHMFDSASYDIPEQEVSVSEMDELNDSLMVLHTEETKLDLEVIGPLPIFSSEEMTLSQSDMKVFIFNTENIESSQSTLLYTTFGSVIGQNDLFEPRIQLLETSKEDQQTFCDFSIVFFGSLIENASLSLISDADIDIKQSEVLMVIDNTLVVSFNDIAYVHSDRTIEALNDKSDMVDVRDNYFDILLEGEETAVSNKVANADWNELFFFETTKIYEMFSLNIDTLATAHTVFESDINDTDGAEIYAFEAHEHVLEVLDGDRSIAADITCGDKLLDTSEYTINEQPLESLGSSPVFDIHDHDIGHVKHAPIVETEILSTDNMLTRATIATEITESNPVVSLSIHEVSESVFEQFIPVTTVDVNQSSLAIFDSHPVIMTEMHEFEEIENVPLLSVHLHEEEIPNYISDINVSFNDIARVHSDRTFEVVDAKSDTVDVGKDCFDILLEGEETAVSNEFVNVDWNELFFFETTKIYEMFSLNIDTLITDHTAFEADINDTDGAEIYAFEAHEHVLEVLDSDRSIAANITCGDKFLDTSGYTINEQPLESLGSSPVFDIHDHDVEHVTLDWLIETEESSTDNMAVGTTVAAEIVESNTGISLSVHELSESMFDQCVPVTTVNVSESLLITFDNQPVIATEIHESEEIESVPILSIHLHKSEMPDSISVIDTDTVLLTPTEWLADISAVFENSSNGKNITKKKKRIWLIPMRANFWNKWFTKKTR